MSAKRLLQYKRYNCCIFCVCVCCLIYPSCKTHAPYYTVTYFEDNLRWCRKKAAKGKNPHDEVLLSQNESVPPVSSSYAFISEVTDLSVSQHDTLYLPLNGSKKKKKTTHCCMRKYQPHRFWGGGGEAQLQAGQEVQLKLQQVLCVREN
jgi:hypothetical protein